MSVNECDLKHSGTIYRKMHATLDSQPNPSLRNILPKRPLRVDYMDKNVSEYNNEYVSEYPSKYVSEYTSEYISECTSECSSD